MVYLINYTDMTPDNCRHDNNRESLTVSKTCPRTNSSHEERASGWLGQTNNTDANAIGSWDDDIDSADDIADEIIEHSDRLSLVSDRDELIKWISSDSADDFEITKTNSRKYNGTGWTMTVPGDDEDNGLELDAADGFVFVDEAWDGYGDQSSEHDLDEWTDALDAAGISHDVAEYSEMTGSGSMGVWAVVVRDEDEDAARAAINVWLNEYDSDDLETLGIDPKKILGLCTKKVAAHT